MDVAPEDLRRKEGGEGEEEGEGGAATAAASRRLDQEPALAARIMLEDCMCLLLDVTDIDQIFVAAAGGELSAAAGRCNPALPPAVAPSRLAAAPCAAGLAARAASRVCGISSEGLSGSPPPPRRRAC